MPDQQDVSPNNPCPFLRALVANGYVDGHVMPLSKLMDDIGRAGGHEGLHLLGDKGTAYVIAAIANGFTHVLKSISSGAILDELRDGPLDKHGAGSRILDADAHVHLEQIDRLASFGQDFPNPDGGTERGLNNAQIKAYVADNLKRAGKEGRVWYKMRMAGEWPVLFDMLGKGEGEQRYLSVAEVRTLFVDRQLPKRITDRLRPPRI
jgi:hypothetical protein